MDNKENQSKYTCILSMYKGSVYILCMSSYLWTCGYISKKKNGRRYRAHIGHKHFDMNLNRGVVKITRAKWHSLRLECLLLENELMCDYNYKL